MCGCTSSFGPDRYGPIYAGRYGFLGGAPARMPWLEEQAARAGAWLGPAGDAAAGGPKVDPNCPGCRVGAYARGEALPPQGAPAGGGGGAFASYVLAPAGQAQSLEEARRAALAAVLALRGSNVFYHGCGLEADEAVELWLRRLGVTCEQLVGFFRDPTGAGRRWLEVAIRGAWDRDRQLYAATVNRLVALSGPAMVATQPPTPVGDPPLVPKGMGGGGTTAPGMRPPVMMMPGGTPPMPPPATSGTGGGAPSGTGSAPANTPAWRCDPASIAARLYQRCAARLGLDLAAVSARLVPDALFAAAPLKSAGQLAYGSLAGPPRAALDPTRGLAAPVGAYPIGFGAPPAVTFDVLGPVLAGLAAPAAARDPYDAGRWVAPGAARPAVVYSRLPGFMVY